jgi:hypothetical protein
MALHSKFDLQPGKSAYAASRPILVHNERLNFRLTLSEAMALATELQAAIKAAADSQ